MKDGVAEENLVSTLYLFIVGIPFMQPGSKVLIPSSVMVRTNLKSKCQYFN